MAMADGPARAPAPSPARPKPRGTVSVGPVTARGGLDREIIRRIFLRLHRDELVGCYGKGLEKKPDLAGRLTVQFTVTVHGTAAACKVASSTLDSPVVESCIVAAVRTWEFPRSNCGCESQVSVALEFSPQRTSSP
jgi:hypothetical protein